MAFIVTTSWSSWWCWFSLTNWGLHRTNEFTLRWNYINMQRKQCKLEPTRWFFVWESSKLSRTGSHLAQRWQLYAWLQVSFCSHQTSPGSLWTRLYSFPLRSCCAERSRHMRDMQRPTALCPASLRRCDLVTRQRDHNGWRAFFCSAARFPVMWGLLMFSPLLELPTDRIIRTVSFPPHLLQQSSALNANQWINLGRWNSEPRAEIWCFKQMCLDFLSLLVCDHTALSAQLFTFTLHKRIRASCICPIGVNPSFVSF